MDKETANRETVSSVFNYLLERSGDKVAHVAAQIGVSVNSLYTIKSRQSDRVEIKLLKKIADYFGEDVSIFCGLNSYEPPVKLSQRDIELVKLLRGFSESDIELVKRFGGFSESDKELLKLIDSFTESDRDLVRQFAGFSNPDKERIVAIIARLKENPGQMDFMEKFLSITDEVAEKALTNPRNRRL